MNALWKATSIISGNLVRTRGAAANSSAYLTFDDGPHPEHTGVLLDLLARHDAKGTFFLIGRAAEKFPDLVHRILAEGHSIGNHSMTHPKMRALGARAQWSEIDRADAVLQRFDGQERHMFRPPNGRVTLPALVACVWHRQPLLLWSLDSLDYKLGPAEVVRRLNTITPIGGDVLLFHDDGACAVQALEVLLPAWKAASLQFLALTG